MNKVVPLDGFGGGSNPLNFKIVGGTTQPSNPTENMIWANTDQEITSYYISPNSPTKSHFRYIKLQIDALAGSGTIVQMSEVRFIDNNGSFFTYPSNASATSTISAFSSSTTANMLIDNNTGTKFCSERFVSGCYVLFDLGDSNYIDVFKYNKWQWYTAEDTAAYPERNLKNFSLWGSKDGSIFELLDNVTNYSAPSQNQTLAYTGQIKVNANNNTNIKNGMLQIYTDTSSPVEFNALKKNYIQIYPVYARQYIDDVWQDVEVKSYQNGKWMDWSWSNTLYSKGIINNSIGGGLEIYKSENGASIDFGISNITIDITTSTKSGIIGTKNKIDLSKYKKMFIIVDSTTTNGEFVFSVVNSKTVSYADLYTNAVAKTKFSEAGVYELNISNCDSAYVVFGGVESAIQKMIISKWYFE